MFLKGKTLEKWKTTRRVGWEWSYFSFHPLSIDLLWCLVGNTKSRQTNNNKTLVWYNYRSKIDLQWFKNAFLLHLWVVRKHKEMPNTFWGDCVVDMKKQYLPEAHRVSHSHSKMVLLILAHSKKLHINSQISTQNQTAKLRYLLTRGELGQP